MPGRSSFGTYLQAAFFNRWNMLFFSSAIAASFIAPMHDVGLALTAAAEIAFLAFCSVNERFQRAIDSQADAHVETKTAEQMRMRFNQLFYGLDTSAQARFNELRTRCEVLRDVKLGPGDEDATTRIEKVADMQLSGVNRLLWVFLKLLHTRATLMQFFKATNEGEIKNLIQVTQLRIDALPKEKAGEIDDKKRRSLEDTLKTATSRWDNWKRAKENAEYVELELERIAAKLTALAELAINRQDPDRITTEVDQVTQSVQTTEQTMSELNDITGFTAEDMVAPQILNRPSGRQRVRA
jgi:hypothetical protein